MANQKLTDKTELAEQVGSGDLLMVVDVNDTTGSSSGTSKKMDFKYLMQTDKFSLNNTEVQALHTTPKTLVGALSGYMVTVYNVTLLVTYASSTESSNSNLIFGYDPSQDSQYYGISSRIMGSQTSSNTYMYGGNQATHGVKGSSIINSAFSMWSNAAFNGGWSCDVYVTYAYTKVL
tara:strand:- start:251 stop:781 length:531 start_codon:yes stop_codon:yes gene_type:complete